jgi:hypothetical protein
MGEIEKLKMQLEWFNDFVDYIQETDHKAYNYACEYADDYEKDRLKGEENE